MVTFTATAYKLDKWYVLRIPEEASKELPSRGQVMARGTINGHDFAQVLEPDGGLGHWVKLSPAHVKNLKISEGSPLTLSITPSKIWPEPTLPQDFKKALVAAPAKVASVWADITPMARYEWVRWVNATRVPDTRVRRIEVSLLKMQSGKRRPCCFNLSACTDPDLSKNGRLLGTMPSGL